jgi:hypothetical protein
MMIISLILFSLILIKSGEIAQSFGTSSISREKSLGKAQFEGTGVYNDLYTYYLIILIPLVLILIKKLILNYLKNEDKK